MRPPRSLFILPLWLTLASAAGELRLTDPSYDRINASALDQPRLFARITDPARGDAFITWFNPASEQVEPVQISAFIDTGASGFAISHLHAAGELDQANLGLAAADYLGAFTEIGIGGTEVGDVTRPLGVWVQTSPIDANGELTTEDFTAFGDFSLWVRREIGEGEYNELLGPDPINLVGMPVMRQRRLLLDPAPMVDLGPMTVRLLAPGETEPVTHATVPLVLRDFIDETPPAGEVLPSHQANPLVPGVTLTEGSDTVVGEWLLDTGAGSSFVSFAHAKALGLIPADYPTLAAFMVDYAGPRSQIGGIGATQTVPILNVDRIGLSTSEGATLVWRNVDLLVADVAGLDGIFGMNLLVPAVTIDSGLLEALTGEGQSSSLVDALGILLGLLFDVSPGPFTAIVIDTTDATAPVMRLATPFADGTVYGWLGEHFSAAERLHPQVGALTADPDGDGASNLLEYALGLDPGLASPRAELPAGAMADVAGQKHLALTFTRPAGGRADLDYVVERSTDLATWSRDSALVTLHATTAGPGDGRETLTYRATQALTAGAPRMFLRLVIEVKP